MQSSKPLRTTVIVLLTYCGKASQQDSIEVRQRAERAAAQEKSGLELLQWNSAKAHLGDAAHDSRIQTCTKQ